MNKNFKILGAVMLGFMSFSCNNNQGNNSSELPQYGSRTYNSETLRNILQQPEQQRQLKR